jgi:D-serine deaminase-like pyridoxal phosphate-dependent protein
VHTTLQGSSLALRIVVKSLPAAQLVDSIADRLGTQRYMVFNGSMLTEMARRKPESDLLLGKPLPVIVAEQFYKSNLASSAPFAEPQWLIDTPERLEQYAQMASRRLCRRRRFGARNRNGESEHSY